MFVVIYFLIIAEIGARPETIYYKIMVISFKQGRSSACGDAISGDELT